MVNWMRSAAKQLVFNVLGSKPVTGAKLRAISNADAVTVLNLHRVGLPDGSEYPSLAPRLFEMLLRFARRHFEIITFAQLAAAQPGRKPKIILSFDDGYEDFAVHAAPLLRKYDVAVNQNIIPECVETGMPPLNVLMQDFVGRAPDEALGRLEVAGFAARPLAMSRQEYGRRLSHFIKSRPIAAQREIAEELLPQVRRLQGFVPARMLSLDQIRGLSRHHEIGVHSYSHATLGLEAEDYVRDDVEQCKDWFAANLEMPVNVYAFPNGSYRPAQIDIVRKAGIEQILLVGEDFSTSTASAHKRFTFYADTPAEMRFRATGGFRRPKRRQ